MKIVTLKELMEMPAGTVFAEYEDYDYGDLYIKTADIEYAMFGGKKKPVRPAQMPIKPRFYKIKGDERKDFFVTNWETDDGFPDYEDKGRFAVFNKTEIRHMINVLTWALNGCDEDINMDAWFGDDGKVYTEDEIVEPWED